MNTTLSVAAFQMDLQWHEPVKNLDQIASMVKGLTDTDLLILPEMFSTGFTMEPDAVAEKMNGPTIQQLKEMAKANDIAIMGSLVIKEQGNFYNRMLLIQPDGQVESYDKRHLFSLAGEDQIYTRGNARPIWEVKDWRICPQICYDVRFPVWSSNTADYDLLIYVANWPSPRHSAWTKLLDARAIENQAYVVGVNRVGMDQNGWTFSGGSKITDYQGKVIEEAMDKEMVLQAKLNKANLEEFREKFPFLKDNDRFTIEDRN